MTINEYEEIFTRLTTSDNPDHVIFPLDLRDIARLYGREGVHAFMRWMTARRMQLSAK